MAIVAITAALIERLANRRDVVAEFPFLGAYARPAVASCCGSRSAPVNLGRVINQLMGLPPNRRQVLKDLVGADRLTARVVKAGRNRPVEF